MRNRARIFWLAVVGLAAPYPIESASAAPLSPVVFAVPAADNAVDPVAQRRAFRHGGGFRGGFAGRRAGGFRGGSAGPRMGGYGRGIGRRDIAGGYGRPGYRGGGMRRGIAGGYARRGVVVRRNVVVGGVYRPYGAWWRPGAAIAAGAAIGFVGAATAAAWAGAPPAPGYCWYYTNASRTKGFWDRCP